jgi:magnesium chelatase family protein
MNACKCGYLGHYLARCRCTPDQVAQYRGRLSGPLLNRIDLHVDVPALREADFLSSARGESSAIVRERVVRARELQRARQGVPNARLSGREIEERAAADAEGLRLLRDAFRSWGSRRGRTIASSKWRAPSPTCGSARPCDRRMWRKRSATAAPHRVKPL